MMVPRWSLVFALTGAVACGDDAGGSADSGMALDSGVALDSGMALDSGSTGDAGSSVDGGGPSDGGSGSVTAEDVNAAERAQIEAVCECVFAEEGYATAAECVAGEAASATEEACAAAGFAAADAQEYFDCQVGALVAFNTCVEGAGCDETMLTACDAALTTATDACPMFTDAQAMAYGSAFDVCLTEMVVGPAGSCPDTGATTSTTGSAVFTGSTVLAGDDAQGSCGAVEGTADVQLQWTATITGAYTIDTFGTEFDTVLYVLDACAGTELVCNDDSTTMDTLQSELTLEATAGTEYIIVVDGYDIGDAGDYVVNITPPAT